MMKVKEGFSRPTICLPESAKPRPRPDFKTASGQKKQEPRLQLDGHSKRLRELQRDGRSVTFWMVSGVALLGKVVGFDKYTVTIDSQVDPHGNLVNHPLTLTVYKSAMEGFAEASGS